MMGRDGKRVLKSVSNGFTHVDTQNPLTILRTHLQLFTRYIIDSHTSVPTGLNRANYNYNSQT